MLAVLAESMFSDLQKYGNSLTKLKIDMLNLQDHCPPKPPRKLMQAISPSASQKKAPVVSWFKKPSQISAIYPPKIQLLA